MVMILSDSVRVIILINIIRVAILTLSVQGVRIRGRLEISISLKDRLLTINVRH